MLNSKVISIVGGLPVSSNAKIILLKFVDKQLEKKSVFPSYETIGSWINRGRSTVGSCLLELERSGLIIRIRRGKKRTNVYRICSDLWSFICKNVPFKYWFKSSTKKVTNFVKEKVKKVFDPETEDVGVVNVFSHASPPPPTKTKCSLLSLKDAIDMLENNYEEAIKPI